MPIAEVHDRFRDQVAALQAAALAFANSVTAEEQRSWMTLSLNGWAGDPLDVGGISSAFDRDAINQQYAEMLNDPADSGSLGSCLALKLQVDWLAMLERAFRARHATSVRCAVHSAARRKGHSSGGGVFAVGTLAYVQDIIKAGS